MIRPLFACIALLMTTVTLAADPSTVVTPSPVSAGTGEKFSVIGKRFQVDDRFADLKPAPGYPIDQDPGGPHSINDFPPEPRDVFHLMDQVMTDVIVGPDGRELPDLKGQPLPPGAKQIRKLKPLQFDVPSGSYDQANPDQRAIYGRNTWLLWCDGNEDFWNWLAQDAYGVLDFLKALDSRKRSSRLRDMGLINQPGLKGTDKRGPWGLYLDVVEKRIGEEGDPGKPGYFSPYRDPKPTRTNTAPNSLESDGVDPHVYGYPSGVIGLRLFPNPKFDDNAKKWWNAEAFYNDPVYAKNPRTVRPLLVGMSCVVCHIGPHPLNPPTNAEEPNWSNLSSILGNQYFRTSTAFGTPVERGNFLWHYLASQQPGTIDTSMVSSDQINNANAMNALFELPARIGRAKLNPAEIQGTAAQTFPGDGAVNRLVPRILMDGADSVGVFGALARVFLNIGTYHDEWNRCSNPIIGFVPQKPFSLDACRRNSVYWRVNENFRVEYLKDFFLWEKRMEAKPGEPLGHRIQSATAGMPLKEALIPAVGGGSAVKFVDQPENRHHWDEPEALQGSRVFTRNCMICHSSKQPVGFEVQFSHDPVSPVAKWAEMPKTNGRLILPYAEANWEEFKRSPAYTNYVGQAIQIVGDGDADKLRAFLDENYLSTDLRIPVSLTGTTAGRALASNALLGQVWEEFASETYRQLSAVGAITYFDPFSRTEKKFQPPGHGPGYYRVPSLVSVWATAPLLHNNALGLYLPDQEANRRVSVEGRLQMFDDAINKLLWKDKRGRSPSGECGLRDSTGAAWRGQDPGWIFRTDMDTEIRIPRGHLRHLVLGILPGFVPGWLQPLVLSGLDHPWILPVLLVALSLLLITRWPRGYFYLLIATGVLLVTVFALTGLHYLLPEIIWLLPLALLVGGVFWITGAPSLSRASTSKVGVSEEPSAKADRDEKRLRFVVDIARWSAVAAHGLCAVGLLAGLWLGREFVDGQLGDLRVGPLPKGTPVNALMNMNPNASVADLLGSVRGLAATLGKLRADDRLPAARRMNEAERLAVFEREAGPALMRASKCPDWVLDRGHYFGEALSDNDKNALIAFLKTL